jgi:outer membrane protein OmpA-like peptidoglycan-associated protein
MKTKLTLTAFSLLLAACGGEAGKNLDTGSFGNATMNNTLTHTGARGFTIELNTRFAEEVPAMVNFAFNEAILDDLAMDILTRQADWIKQFPEVTFRVYGHTDSVGDPDFNKRLGLRRAQAVVAFLATQGIDRNRLEALASFGETQPLVVSSGRERANRRTVTEVSGVVEMSSQTLDGHYASLLARDYVASAASASALTSEGSGGFSN